ncbi:hypothetical protein D3C84_1172900 [compost metagenome]
MIARLAFAEGVTEADLAVVQGALGEDVDVAEHHLALARQRQADVVRQWLGVVQLVRALISPDQTGEAQRHGGAQ